MGEYPAGMYREVEQLTSLLVENLEAGPLKVRTLYFCNVPFFLHFHAADDHPRPLLTRRGAPRKKGIRRGSTLSGCLIV